MNRKFFITILCCAGLWAAGCSSARRGEPFSSKTPGPSLEKGRMVFVENCNQCHPHGEGGLGPALNNKPAPRFLMKTQVRQGLGAMPAFDKTEIGPRELDALMDYLIALRKSPSAKL